MRVRVVRCVIGIQPTRQALTKPSWPKIWNKSVVVVVVVVGGGGGGGCC